MKHYFNPTSRAATTDWMLKELDAPHEQIVVDFMSGGTSTPEFRAINPMGKLPTLVDDGVVVTEAAAICAYLADKFDDKGNPVSMGWGDMERGMAAVEAMTPDEGWALGDRFTAADVVFGGNLAFFSGFKLLEASPKVEAYIDRIKARPMFQATHEGF